MIAILELQSAASGNGACAVAACRLKTEPLEQFDAISGQSRIIRAHGRRISGFEYSRDGTPLFTSGLDGFARCWDAATLKLIGNPMRSQFLSIHSMALSPNGSRLVTGSTHGTLTIWDAIDLEGRFTRIDKLKFVTNEVLIVEELACVPRASCGGERVVGFCPHSQMRP